MKKCILLLAVLSSFFLGISAMEESKLQRAQSSKRMNLMKNIWLVESTAKSDVHRAFALLSVPKININYQDRFGRTVLHYAALNGLFELAEELLRMNADTSIKDDEGNTAAMLAEKEKEREIARLIAQAQ